jgi:large subunit ribosomal protein L19
MSSYTIPKIAALEAEQKRQLPTFRVGDQVRVHYRIREGEKERVQVFQGVVLRRARGGVGATFTVRKVSFGGVGVERIFPEHSPRIERLEVVSRGVVRRARLYYLRSLAGKAARLRQERGGGNVEDTAAETSAS